MSTIPLVIPAGKIASDLTGFVTRVDLSTVTDTAWWALVNTDRNIRVRSGGVDLPCDVVWVDPATKTGEVYFKADLSASTSNDFTLVVLAGGGPVAPTTPTGRNAVWSDYEAFVCGAYGTPGLINRVDGTPLTLASGTATVQPDGWFEVASANLYLQGLSQFSVYSMAISTYTTSTSADNRGHLTYTVEGSSANAHRVSLVDRDASGRPRAVWNSVNGWRTYGNRVPGVQERRAATFNGTTQMLVYLNGALALTDNGIAQRPPSGPCELVIGGEDHDGDEYWTGSLNRAYLRDGLLSASWLSAERESWESPATFYSVGAEPTTDFALAADTPVVAGAFGVDVITLPAIDAALAGVVDQVSAEMFVVSTTGTVISLGGGVPTEWIANPSGEIDSTGWTVDTDGTVTPAPRTDTPPPNGPATAVYSEAGQDLYYDAPAGVPPNGAWVRVSLSGYLDASTPGAVAVAAFAAVRPNGTTVTLVDQNLTHYFFSTGAAEWVEFTALLHPSSGDWSEFDHIRVLGGVLGGDTGDLMYAGGVSAVTHTAAIAVTGTFDVVAIPLLEVYLDGEVPPISGSFKMAPPGLSMNGVLPGIESNILVDVVAPIETPPATLKVVAPTVYAQAWSGVVGGAQVLYSDYQTVSRKATRLRTVIAGRDVSYWRDVVTPDPSYTLTEPFGYGPGSLSLPQVNAAIEFPGRGALDWLVPGAPVKIQRVQDNTVVETVWRGILLDPQHSGNDLVFGLAGDLSGRAALIYRPQPLWKHRNDLGFWWSRAVAAARRPFEPYGGPNTNIKTYARGGSWLLDYMNELASMGVNGDGTQWTCMPDAAGVYRVFRKNLTTIHATAYIDDARTAASLTRDPAEEPNRIYGTGVAPSGRRVNFGVYPVLVDTDPPPFPGHLEQGDSGDGVTALIVRLSATGYLSYADRPGGYDGDVTRAVRRLQQDAGLAVTGEVNEATWNALFDTSVTGYDTGGSHIEPSAQRSYTKRYLRRADGTVIGDNPDYDPSRILIDREVDFGTGFTEQQMSEWSQELLVPESNWTGTITFSLGGLISGRHDPGDPLPANRVMEATQLKAGQNIWLPTWDGGTLVHVSAVSVEDVVTATVDTRARDTMAAWEVIARNVESRRDPARAWYRRNRSSGQTKDAITEFSEVGGIISRTRLNAGWTVFPVVVGQEGTIARMRLILDNPAEFAVAVFGKRVGPGELAGRIGNPLTPTGAAAWSKRTVAAANRDDFILYQAGDDEEPCGYYPGSKAEPPENDGTPPPRVVEVTDGGVYEEPAGPQEGAWGPDGLSGRHDDDAGFGYRAVTDPVIYIAIWTENDNYLRGGRIIWSLEESGS